MLFHSDIRLPDGFTMPTERVGLSWTRHADEARRTDPYAPVIPAFTSLPLSCFRLIEVEWDGQRATKYVVRGRWTANYDLVFVLIPNRGPWTVKTVWVNERNDLHATLDRSKYVN